MVLWCMASIMAVCGSGCGGGSDLATPIAPAVSLASPLDSAIDVIFNEVMNPLTLTAASFTLKQGTMPVDGTVTYAGSVATFAATNVLASNTLHTATTTVVAEDLAGNPLATAYSWSFTTGEGVLLLEPVPVGPFLDPGAGDLVGSTKAKNVFWQIGTAATLGTGVVFKGTLMSDAALIVFDGDDADRGVRALVEMKRLCEARLAEQGFTTEAVVKVHRKLFKKHSPPVRYIPLGEAHRS